MLPVTVSSRVCCCAPLVLVALALSGSFDCGSSGATACTFTVSTNEVSPQIPTVGVVEWSLSGAAPV